MRLIFINQSLGIGGAETFNKGLLVWLQKHDFSITAFVTNKTFQKVLNAGGIETKHIPVIVDIIGDWKGFIKGLVLLPFAFVYYTILILKNKNTDIILMSGFVEKILVTPVAKLLKIPVFWIEFAPLTSVFNKFFTVPKLLYSLVINLPNLIIVPSMWTINSLQSELNINRNKLLLIPCAEDIEENNYSKIEVDNYSVCCVSRLEKGKGQDLLLKSWKHVEKEIPEAKLVIVGEGDFKKYLDIIIKENNLKNVIFKGRVEDALKETAKSSIVVFPTVWPLEGFGLVAIEAMALGKPVVCFDFGPVPEIVDKTTGILVESKNTDLLANAIIKLLKSSKLRKQLGQTGRKKYLKEFTFDNIGQKYLKMFNEIKYG